MPVIIFFMAVSFSAGNGASSLPSGPVAVIRRPSRHCGAIGLTVPPPLLAAFWPVDLPSYSATIGRRLSKWSERQGGCYGDKN
jgi:hypothetical protein